MPQQVSPSQKLWSQLREFGRPKNQRTSNGNNYRREFIIIGLGRFGTSLAMTLNAYKHNVLAVDNDINRVQEVARVLPHVLQLDATSIEAMHEVGADSFDTGIVCIGTDFESNLLATVSLRKLGVRRVIAKARTMTQQEILLRVGADEVILPEHEAGVHLGRRLSAIDFVDFMELGPNISVVEIVTPDVFVGKSLKDAAIRQRYDLTVVALKRGEQVLVSPKASEIIHKEDILVVLGKTENCEKLC